MTKNKTESEAAGGISRRDFACHAAFAAATVAVMPASVLAQPAPALTFPAPQAPGNEQKLSPESQAEVDARIQVILKKYGHRLSDEQKKDIQRLVTEGQKPLEALRAYKIANSDQPATVLKIYPDALASSRRSAAAGAVRPRGKE